MRPMGYIFGFIYLNYLPSVRERPSPESLADCSDDTGGGETAVVVIVEEHLHRFRRAKYPSLPSWLSFRGFRGGGEFRNLADLEFRALVPELTPPLFFLLAPLPQEDLRCQIPRTHSC